EGHRQALFQPVLRIEVERVAKDDGDRAVGIAQRDQAAPRGFAVRHEIERRLGGGHVGERHGRHVQRLRQVANDLGAVLALQHFDIHLMFPASSKIGMYMSTTTRPTASPSTVISTGSKARVNQSTKRATSSSWKRAIWPSIWPMSPLRSPTSIIRAATGVARPAAPSAADIGWPSSIRTRALLSCGCRCFARRPSTISSARTAGMPARISMPAVRY